MMQLVFEKLKIILYKLKKGENARIAILFIEEVSIYCVQVIKQYIHESIIMILCSDCDRMSEKTLKILTEILSTIKSKHLNSIEIAMTVRIESKV